MLSSSVTLRPTHRILFQAQRQSRVTKGHEKFSGEHKSFVPSNSRVKTKKRSSPQKLQKTVQTKVLTAQPAKKRFLLPNSGVMISILGISGLELYSSGTKHVTFFGAQSSLRAAQFLFVVGTSCDLEGHGSGMPPLRGAGPVLYSILHYIH